MPTKIRLQRRGKKASPFYHIVIADGRAPRDGKYIERIGTYNPVSKPAEIILDFNKALDWLQKGAQPTETVRSILSFKGVLYKAHLLKGVKKGALTEEQAEIKLRTWLSEKEEKVERALKDQEQTDRNVKKEKLDAEIKVKEARAEKFAEKRAKEAAEKAAEAREAVEEVKKEEPKAEEKKEEVKEKKKEEPKTEEKKEEVKEEKKEEPKAEEKKEEVKEEKKEEPKTEEKKEEVKKDKKEEIK